MGGANGDYLDEVVFTGGCISLRLGCVQVGDLGGGYSDCGYCVRGCKTRKYRGLLHIVQLERYFRSVYLNRRKSQEVIRGKHREFGERNPVDVFKSKFVEFAVSNQTANPLSIHANDHGSLFEGEIDVLLTFLHHGGNSLSQLQ